jgi:hypothetical protein
VVLRVGHKEGLNDSHENDKEDSCYNYYLILLTIPDLLLNIFLIGLYAGYANQSYIDCYAGYVVLAFREGGIDMPLDYSLVFGCCTASIWMIAVVAHSVFGLLKNTHQGIRVKPPTMKKATIQRMIVYLYALILSFIHFFVDGSIIR